MGDVECARMEVEACIEGACAYTADHYTHSKSKDR